MSTEPAVGNPSPGFSTEGTYEERGAFDALVYTPLDEALVERERRAGDPALANYVARKLPNGIPPVLAGGRSLALFRHVATPNYETWYFLEKVRGTPGYEPVILEYAEDQFNDRNEAKYHLGNLRFHKGLNARGDPLYEYIRTIDFNASNAKPLSTIAATWGEPFVEMHHAFFHEQFPRSSVRISDISVWLSAFGERADQYYEPFFALFLKDAILCEDFLLTQKEAPFTRKVVLPAFRAVCREAGVKPLIAKLVPTEMESDVFWYAYPAEGEVFIKGRLASTPAL